MGPCKVWMAQVWSGGWRTTPWGRSRVCGSSPQHPGTGASEECPGELVMLSDIWHLGKTFMSRRTMFDPSWLCLLAGGRAAEFEREPLQVQWEWLPFKEKCYLLLSEKWHSYCFSLSCWNGGSTDSGQESTLHFNYPIKVLYVLLKCQPEERNWEAQEISEHRFSVLWTTKGNH